MAKPTYNTIAHGQQSWDADLDDNFTLLGDTAIPVPEYADFASLPAAGSYDRCLVCTTDTNTLYFSDGTAWRALGSRVLHSYPWLHSLDVASVHGSIASQDRDTIVHYPGWTLTRDTGNQANGASSVSAGEEQDGNNGDRRTTYVEQAGLSTEESRTTIYDLRVALPDDFVGWRTEGIVLKHKILVAAGAGDGSDDATVTIEVFDPTTASDTVAETGSQTIASDDADDADYEEVSISGADLNGMTNPFQAGDMLHLRITLSGTFDSYSPDFRLGRLSAYFG